MMTAQLVGGDTDLAVGRMRGSHVHACIGMLTIAIRCMHDGNVLVLVLEVISRRNNSTDLKKRRA